MTRRPVPAEVDRAERLVARDVAVVLVAVEVGHEGAVARVLHGEHVAGGRLADEVEDRAQDRRRAWRRRR